MIRKRKDVAAYANKMLNDPQSEALTALKHGCWHIGFIEIRLLMDYIYGEAPYCAEECIEHIPASNKY